MSNPQNGFLSAVVLIFILILILLVAGGYYFYNNQSVKFSSPPTFQNSLQDNLSPSPNIRTSNWNKYSSKEDFYDFQYPSDWSVSGVGRLELKSNNQTLITIEILKDNKGKFDYCVINALDKKCEWVTDSELQTIIDWREDSNPQALVTISSGRFALVNLEEPTLVDKPTFKNLLSTFKSTVISSLQPWNPVCDMLNLDDFEITIEYGDGLTHIARKALQSYLNSLALSDTAKGSGALLSEEKIYIEDYIRKTMSVDKLVLGKKVVVPCRLVEEAVVKVRSLTIEQKQNLEKYSQSVNQLQISEALQKAVDESFKNSNLNPQILDLK